MLKKVLCFLVMIVICSNISFAVEEDIYKDFYTISNKQVVSQNNERVIISFDITNKTSNYYPELYFTPTLKISGEEGVLDNFYLDYYKFDATKFSLEANETKLITLNLKLPKNMPRRNYLLSLTIYTITHRVSDMQIDFSLNNKYGTEDGFIDSKNLMPSLKLKDGSHVRSDFGPNVSIDELPQMYLKLKSNFSENKKVYPHYVIYERSKIYNPKSIYNKYGEAVEFKPGEIKELFLDLPGYLIPESYELVLNFTDEEGNAISNLFEFRYVIKGESAKINSIVLEKNNVKTYIYGPADRTTLDVKFKISVYDENDNLIKTEEKNIKIGGEEACFITDIGSINSKKIKVDAKVSTDKRVLVSKIEEIEVERKAGNKIFSDIIGTKYEEAVKILNGLGIINGYPDNTFKPENQITRAEFSTIVTKLLNLDISDDEDIIFNDVENHWAKPYINKIYRKGLVSGYPDGTFKPQNNITYAEAITILVNGLGYRNEVNKSGIGWPYNYINKARELDLGRNLDIADYMVPANRGDISILTLNAYLLKE